MAGEAFIFVVETTGASENFTIPCRNIGTYSATVDWGDGGGTSSITAWNDSNLTHTYATAGTYTISITGTLPTIYFNNGGDKDKLRKVVQLGDVGWLSLEGSFHGCFSSGSYDSDYFSSGTCNTINVDSLSQAFKGWSSVTNPPNLSTLDTDSVTTMYEAFRDWSAMTTGPDFSGWNTSSLLTTYRACANWTSMVTPPNFADWDTSNVTTMRVMCSNWNAMTTPPDFSLWNTSSCVDMFSFALNWPAMAVLPDFSNFDMSGVADMRSMCRNWGVTIDETVGIQDWDISALTTADSFMLSSEMTTSTYNALLVNWEAQTPNSSVLAHFGSSTYYDSGAPNTAHDSLTGTYGWTITDGGEISAPAGESINLSYYRNLTQTLLGA